MVGGAYDGAGRSSQLACLPTARGTVAPTRGQGTWRSSLLKSGTRSCWSKQKPARRRRAPGPPRASQTLASQVLQGLHNGFSTTQGSDPFRASTHKLPASPPRQGFPSPSTLNTCKAAPPIHSKHPSQLLALEMFKDSRTSK